MYLNMCMYRKVSFITYHCGRGAPHISHFLRRHLLRYVHFTQAHPSSTSKSTSAGAGVDAAISAALAVAAGVVPGLESGAGDAECNGCGNGLTISTPLTRSICVGLLTSMIALSRARCNAKLPNRAEPWNPVSGPWSPRPKASHSSQSSASPPIVMHSCAFLVTLRQATGWQTQGSVCQSNTRNQ